MANVWSGVTIDCLDPQRVARFWSALLGREPDPRRTAGFTSASAVTRSRGSFSSPYPSAALLGRSASKIGHGRRTQHAAQEDAVPEMISYALIVLADLLKKPTMYVVDLRFAPAVEGRAGGPCGAPAAAEHEVDLLAPVQVNVVGEQASKNCQAWQS